MAGQLFKCTNCGNMGRISNGMVYVYGRCAKCHHEFMLPIISPQVGIERAFRVNAALTGNYVSLTGAEIQQEYEDAKDVRGKGNKGRT